MSFCDPALLEAPNATRCIERS